MTSFLDEATSLITPDLLNTVSSAFGVTRGGAQQALTAAIPTVLGSIAARSTDSSFLNELFQMVTHSSAGVPVSSVASSAVKAITSGTGSPLLEMSESLLSSLLGGKADAVSGAIGRMAGTGSAGSGILGTVTAMALSLLGSRVKSGGLSVAELGGSLLGERNALMAAIPSSIAAVLGHRPAIAPVAESPRRAAMQMSNTAPDNPIVAASLIGGLVLLGLYAWNTRTPKVEAPAPVAVVAPAPATTPDSAGATLPNGTAIKFAPTGIEAQLVAFIEDTTKVVDKTTWFDFDRLLFETGSATLVPTSLDQLRNIAEILKAYPKVSLKLGGYTDNVGAAAANMTLSSDRAKTAMAELVKLGVDPARLEAEGYGDTVPVADNGTEEGRAKNRRTAARVTAK